MVFLNAPSWRSQRIVHVLYLRVYFYFVIKIIFIAYALNILFGICLPPYKEAFNRSRKAKKREEKRKNHLIHFLEVKTMEIRGQRRYIQVDMKPSYHVFHFKNLKISLHPDVYEPAEDTFQLLEAVQVKPNDSVLELGTGCGVIALECTRQGCNVCCTDINPHAVALTRKNIKQNKHLLQGSIKIRKGDLFSPIKPHERFDVIIFNPPYLPTTEDEHVDTWFDYATDGGPDGLRTTERFLSKLSQYLKNEGRAYFMFSSLTKRETLTALLKRYQFKSSIVSSQHYNDEQLDVYCIKK